MSSALLRSGFGFGTESLRTIALAALLSIAGAAVIGQFRPGPGVLAGIALAPLVLVGVLDFRVSVLLLVGALFVDFYSWFSFSVWFSLLFVAAYGITHQGNLLEDFRHPLSIPLGVYAVSLVPSVLNLTKPFPVLLLWYNVLAMILLISIIGSSTRTVQDVRRPVYVFFGLTAANGVFAIIEGLATFKRSFGPAGIMFVDYAGMAFVGSLVLAFFARGTQRLWFGGLTALLGVALLVTQTRTTWLVTILASTLFFLVMALSGPRYGKQRWKVVVSFVVAGIGAILLYQAVDAANPWVGARATEFLTEETRDFDEEGMPRGSLATRVLIWYTAWNAFQEHPVTGVGAFSFPFVSERYSTIPGSLYRRYVEGLSPHQTHLSVLAETGVIGFLGFVFLLVSVLKLTMKTAAPRLPGNVEPFGVALSWMAVYALMSMFATDAWLWGHGIVLWSLVLGSMIAYNRVRHAEIRQGGEG